MKVKHDFDVSSRSQSLLNSDEDDGDEEHSPSDYIVVKLEDEESPEAEMDLSIFAPVESEVDEDEDEELSDSSGVSTWRRTNTRERGHWDDASPLKKQSSSGSFRGHHKTRLNFRAEQRQQQDPKCSAANRDMNEGICAEEHTVCEAVPQSNPATGPAEMSGLDTATSPLAAMEPPVFPYTPVQSKSVVGEDQQNILLEVLNHCRFLHAAVERLEQKIDRQMSYEHGYQRSSARLNNGPKAKPPAEEGQLSWSLAQRLGPPVQRNPRWTPPWKRSGAQQGLSRADLKVDNSTLQSSIPPGRGRARGRGRGRGRRGSNNGSKRQSQTPNPAQNTSEPSRDGTSTAQPDDPQPSKVIKKRSWFNKGSKAQQKKKKGLAQVDRDKVKSEVFCNKEETTFEIEVDKKVMIGSALRKVWIPLSVYKEAFKEAEPQKAIVPVLNALFFSNTLSCSAVTGNPAKGIQQLDPNKIEALREFLAEMYPRYDLSLRGETWALCVGVINNITKDLRKRAEKQSHLPEKVGDSGNDAVFIHTSRICDFKS